MNIFNQASKKVTDTVNRMQKKANESMAVNKLLNQIKIAQNDIEKLYRSIGEVTFKAHAGQTEPQGLEELFACVQALNDNILSYRNEIDRLNDVKRCPECGGVVSLDARFCPKCGRKMEAETVVIEEASEAKAETCPECGAERAEGTRFCEKCGHDFDPPQAEDAEEPEQHEE